MTDRRTVLRRIAVGWSLPLLVVIAVVAVPALLNDRLPGRVFESDGSLGTNTWTQWQASTAFWILVVAAVVAIAQLRSRVHAEKGRMWVAVQWGFAVSMGAMPLRLVAVNLDVAGPPLHPDPWWGDAWVVTLVALAAATVGWFAAGPAAPARPATGRPAPGAPRMPLADGERLLWSRAVVSRPGIALATVWLVLTGLTVVYPQPPGGPRLQALLFLVLAVATGVQSWARVRVDDAGVHVTQPLLRRTLVAAGIDEIAQAGTATLDPRELPPTAYGVVRRPQRTVYRAARSGELLTLTLSEGRRLDVTVPDAGTAAALLNSELDRRRAPAC